MQRWVARCGAPGDVCMHRPPLLPSPVHRRAAQPCGSRLLRSAPDAVQGGKAGAGDPAHSGSPADAWAAEAYERTAPPGAAAAFHKRAPSHACQSLCMSPLSECKQALLVQVPGCRGALRSAAWALHDSSRACPGLAVWSQAPQALVPGLRATLHALAHAICDAAAGPRSLPQAGVMPHSGTGRCISSPNKGGTCVLPRCRFAKRLRRAPQQCARHYVGDAPLWPLPEAPAPAACPACGAPRRFELQLMAPLCAALEEAAVWAAELEATEMTASEEECGAHAQSSGLGGDTGPACWGGSAPAACSAPGQTPGPCTLPDSWEWLTVAVFTCSDDCHAGGDAVLGCWEEEVALANEWEV